NGPGGLYCTPSMRQCPPAAHPSRPCSSMRPQRAPALRRTQATRPRYHPPPHASNEATPPATCLRTPRCPRAAHANTASMLAAHVPTRPTSVPDAPTPRPACPPLAPPCLDAPTPPCHAPTAAPFKL
ncbi:hypothetical protein H0H92_008082, partial [Tricholoma furcatifolium]